MPPAAPPLPTRFPCWCRAVYSWGGESKRDLGFIEGDLIECLNAGDGSWWTGRLYRDRRTVGAFPSNFVELLPSQFRPTTKSVPSPAPNVPQSSAPSKSRTFRKPFEAYAKAPHYTSAKQPEIFKETPKPKLNEVLHLHLPKRTILVLRHQHPPIIMVHELHLQLPCTTTIREFLHQHLPTATVHGGLPLLRQCTIAMAMLQEAHHQHRLFINKWFPIEEDKKEAHRQLHLFIIEGDKIEARHPLHLFIIKWFLIEEDKEEALHQLRLFIIGEDNKEATLRLRHHPLLIDKSLELDQTICIDALLICLVMDPMPHTTTSPPRDKIPTTRIDRHSPKPDMDREDPLTTDPTCHIPLAEPLLFHRLLRVV
ncbi:hypothetical protein FSARC_12456 [Fusarium sarcochroum]|uniref:SH3 domain-containing protein n=1 Tax=Fusarium sarcochroum TaxID=1208366 RepID=A0A8H4WWN9_9HYPO|nr:hypothetical protein FSARC_12456 [Fusarium sarcochroum]